MISSSLITATRYHDISCGHRVAGHESKCAYLHGHNYRIYFTCAAESLDAVGRVLDFSVMKAKLCIFLEENWDHRFLAWEKDETMKQVEKAIGRDLLSTVGTYPPPLLFERSIVWTPFNPTAENMADYLLRAVGPRQLKSTGVRLIKVDIEETRKCSASATL